MSEDRSEEYLRNAEECRRQARTSTRTEDKASWLKLAAAWQKLAESTEADALRKQGLISARGIAARSQDSSTQDSN